MPGPLEGKVYVGDLGSGASKQELEDIFSYYGHLRNVWVARNPPGFAFVEFEDNRDAEDAVRGLDGKDICGRRARVELSNGKSRNRNNRGPPPRRHPEDRCYECGESGHYARDCNQQRNSRYSSSRSRSRSPRHRRRSYSRSRSPRRSRSRSLNDRNSNISRSVSRERSYSRGRSESPVPRQKKNSRSRSRRRENGTE